jgi:argininosuccinate synthase
MIVKRLSEFASKDYAGDIITHACTGSGPDMIFRYAASSVLALKKAWFMIPMIHWCILLLSR